MNADRSTCEASTGKASRLRRWKVKKQRVKIEKQKAVPDEDFIFMTNETTRMRLEKIGEKLLRWHPDPDSIRKRFPPSGLNIPARFHRWYNDTSLVRFPLTSSSTLIIQGGIVSQWFIDSYTDAIVCPENARMLGGGGADEAIHRDAGPDLVRACQDAPEVRPGEARITPGFLLPASHVIHTVCPIYNVDINPAASLASSYRNTLRVAKENNIEFIAFPPISCGVYGYPYDEAAAVAISTIREFQNDFKEVHFIHLEPDTYDIWLLKSYELLEPNVPLEVERMIGMLQNQYNMAD